MSARADKSILISGNEWLTAWTGAILLVLFAVLGVTIIRIGQLLWLHLFLGLLLLGPVLLKLASTGYKFARYYAGDPVHRAKGPPIMALRAMGPVIVVSTVVVFVTGIVLLIVGPRDRATLGLIHKVSFIVWLVFIVLHVLGHMSEMGRAMRPPAIGDQRTSSAGRWLALGGSIVGGAVLATALIPHFALWTAPGALPHHHHHFH